MAKVFPEFPTQGAPQLINQNRKLFIYREGKWDLVPLVDRFDGDEEPGPIITEELPVVVEGETILGVGRRIQNTFTIKDLEDLETI